MSEPREDGACAEVAPTDGTIEGRPAANDAPPSVWCRLVWHRPDGTSVEFPLDRDSLVVGRGEEADLRIDEPLVSREHARIERREAGFRVVDLGSTNLTRVNGDVVRQRFLSSGDELRFARARCVFLDAELRTITPDTLDTPDTDQ